MTADSAGERPDYLVGTDKDQVAGLYIRQLGPLRDAGRDRVVAAFVYQRYGGAFVYQRYGGARPVPPFDPVWLPQAADQLEWCTELAGSALTAELQRLRCDQLEAAIRWHHKQWISGDDKCWQDNEELYKLPPEGYTPPKRDTLVELQLCEQYIRSCHRPGTMYISPQRRIEELEAEVKQLRERLGVLENTETARES